MATGRARIVSLAALAAAGAILFLLGPLVSAGAQDDRGTAYSFELSGTIDPATAAWVGSALDEAADQNAEIAIIRLDTPGGLADSLREIVKDVIAAPMPVVVYVTPNGARAASAGAYIVQAGDVAAMAPETNIGSATPVSIGPGSDDDVLGRKIENDAAAFIRALAEVHGRNAAVAEDSVLEADNLTASEALEQNLIDFVAGSEEELLAALEGFQVKGPKARVLHTAGLEVESHEMPLRYEVLQILVNPTIAFLLLTVGIVGLALEILSPGLILPGTLGLISFITGLYGTAQLPVTAAGVLLLAAAIALMIAEAHFDTHGVLGAAGVVSLVLSGLLLFDTDSEQVETSAPVVIAAGLILGGFFAFVIRKVVAARHEPVRTGHEELAGAEAEVRRRLDPEGQVFVAGALWRARVAAGTAAIPIGDRVRVESVEGLTLIVRPASEQPTEQGDS